MFESHTHPAFRSNMEFRAIACPVSDGLWKSYGSTAKDFTSLRRYYAINFSIILDELRRASHEASPASVKMNATTPDPQETREFVARLRARLAQRYHPPGLGAPRN